MRQRNLLTEVLFERYSPHPLLTPADWPYPINSVFNPAATLLSDGSTLLLCRCEDHRGHSHLTVARSKNGIDNWIIDPSPTIEPAPRTHPEEVWGIEDPRITFVPSLNEYFIAYTSFSHGGPGVSLMRTRDFDTFERLGAVMPPDDKDAALLPCKVEGRWAMLHRPSGPHGGHIWISYSPDLRHWGDHRLVLRARRGAWWDSEKIGLSPPLVETEAGWLMIYHGVRRHASGALYRCGLALLDRDEPHKCLMRGSEWVMGPSLPWEREGDVDNVVFPCGVVVDQEDPDLLRVYYGAADTCVGLAIARISQLLHWLEHHNSDGEGEV